MYIQVLAHGEPKEYDASFYIEPCVTLAYSELIQTLSNIYYGEFYSESYVTLAYLKPWHIQNQRHIHSTVKHLSWNILFKFLRNPDIFRTLLYSPLWYIPKNKHIQNPTEYLRWSILLRTLCNYSIFRRPIYSKHSLIQNPSLSVILHPFNAIGLFLYLLKTSDNLWFCDVFSGYRKRPVEWNGLKVH